MIPYRFSTWQEEVSYDNREGSTNAIRSLQIHHKPILRQIGKQLEQIATGTLIRIFGRDLLVTASHVFIDNHDVPLFIGQLSRTIIPLLPPWFATFSSEDDSWDFAFQELTKDQTRFLPASHWITLDHMAPLDYATSYKLYLAIGYPCTKNRKMNFTGIGEIFGYTGVACDRSIYQALDSSDNKHLLLYFDKAKGCADVDGHIKVAPNLHGLSGGGIWLYKEYHRDGQSLSSPLLAAVLTRWKRQQFKVINSIRIDAVLQAVRHQFPETQSVIPPNPRLVINQIAPPESL